MVKLTTTKWKRRRAKAKIDWNSVNNALARTGMVFSAGNAEKVAFLQEEARTIGFSGLLPGAKLPNDIRGKITEHMGKRYPKLAQISIEHLIDGFFFHDAPNWKVNEEDLDWDEINGIFEKLPSFLHRDTPENMAVIRFLFSEAYEVGKACFSSWTSVDAYIEVAGPKITEHLAERYPKLSEKGVTFSVSNALYSLVK